MSKETEQEKHNRVLINALTAADTRAITKERQPFERLQPLQGFPDDLPLSGFLTDREVQEKLRQKIADQNFNQPEAGTILATVQKMATLAINAQTDFNAGDLGAFTLREMGQLSLVDLLRIPSISSVEAHILKSLFPQPPAQPPSSSLE